MNLKKYNFYFPSEPLKEEDFSPIEISILKDYYRNAFLDLIDKIDKTIGKKKEKKIFIDEFCFNILNDIIKKDDLNKEKIGKIIILEKNMKDMSILAKTEENIILFLIQPDIDILNSVIKINLILNSTKKNNTFMKKYLIFIPEENHDVIKHLQDNALINHFTIDTLNFDLIPIDIDLLSLEKENTLKEIYIEKNYTSINDLAYAVAKIEYIFGKIKYKYIKGDLSENFCKSLEEKENDMGINNNTDEILGMIVLDRSVDFLTLMTSNYTFEGLIDEFIGINSGKIKIKESILKEGLNKDDKKKSFSENKNKNNSQKIINYGLTTKINELYCSFRCMHYLDTNKLILLIREYYKKLAEDNKDKKQNISIKKINELTKEMKEFLPYKDNLIKIENILNYILEQLQSNFYIKYIQKEQLMLAGDLAQNLNLYNLYEEHLYEKRDIIILLKLMIIETITQNGIKDYFKLKREILNIYGYQYIFLFRDLENIGLLKEKIFFNNIINIRKNMTDITYNQLIEKFELVNYEFNRENIKDCSYVFGGFCPLSLRLIERAIEGKWNKILDIIKKLQGATICPENEEVISNPKTDKNCMFIIFLGGVTYTEIEGIRFLNRKYKEEYENKKRDKQMQFIIITTGILNTKKIFGNFGIKEKPSFTMEQFKDCFIYGGK